MARRRDPNLLLDGDRVWLPEPEKKEENAATETSTRFVLKREEDKFIIRLRGVQPYIDLFGPIRYELKVGQHERNGEIKAEDEEIEVPLNISIEKGTLSLEGQEYELLIGALDPVWRVSGVQARLKNLGFDCGEVNDALDNRTKAAIRAFQTKYGLEETGRPDEATQQELKRQHGS